MKSAARLLLAATLGATLTFPAFAAPDTVLVKVNGSTILQKDVDAYIQEFNLSPEQAQHTDMIVEELISRRLVYQDALKKKLDKSPEVLAEMESVRVKILLNAAVQEAMKTRPVTEDETRKEYEVQKPQLQQPEFKARHILVKTEDEAKKLITALERGADFSTLANEKSLDSSAQNGGDLGWFPAAQMVPPFAEAVSQMKKGSHSKEPVQTQFGWHVIALDDTRETQAPDYEAIKPQLQQFLQQRHISAYLDELRKTAKIDMQK